MSGTNPSNVARVLAVISLFLLAGCSSKEPLQYQPRHDMDKIAELLDCPSDRTPTCLERMGKPYSCYCMDDDALKRLLEPTKY